jgi:hypothetical protein
MVTENILAETELSYAEWVEESGAKASQRTVAQLQYGIALDLESYLKWIGMVIGSHVNGRRTGFEQQHLT